MIVRSALTAIKPESFEEVVQILWQTIIIEWFPQREGYKYAFKAQMLANDNAPDAIVIRVVAHSQNPQSSTEFTECPILVVECKRPSLDTPTEWNRALKGQVLEDLYETGNSKDRIFAALAIGKKVRFYRFDGKAQLPLVPLHSDTIDMVDDAGLAQVEAMMDQVKQQGYQWAMS
jgi:hypothetical protein